VAAALAATLIGAQARAQQVEVNLVGGTNSVYWGGGGGVGVGLELGPRVVALVGLGAGYSSGTYVPYGDQYRTFNVDVPVDLKIYCRLRRVGALLPTVRLGVGFRYQHSSTSSGAWVLPLEDTKGVTGRALVGLEYLVTPRLGISVEGGVTASSARSSYQQDSSSYRWIATMWQAGIVLHL
jgi:hypothetical protein